MQSTYKCLISENASLIVETIKLMTRQEALLALFACRNKIEQQRKIQYIERIVQQESIGNSILSFKKYHSGVEVKVENIPVRLRNIVNNIMSLPHFEVNSVIEHLLLKIMQEDGLVTVTPVSTEDINKLNSECEGKSVGECNSKYYSYIYNEDFQQVLINQERIRGRGRGRGRGFIPREGRGFVPRGRSTHTPSAEVTLRDMNPILPTEDDSEDDSEDVGLEKKE